MSEVFTLSTLFYTSMVAFSVVTLIVEIICIRSTSLPIAKWFENSFYLVIIAAISEWLVVVGRGFPVEAQGLLVMCKTIEMIISPIIPVSIALSVSRERIGIRHLIPLSVNALIVLANIFIKFIVVFFYFTPLSAHSKPVSIHLLIKKLCNRRILIQNNSLVISGNRIL